MIPDRWKLAVELLFVVGVFAGGAACGAAAGFRWRNAEVARIEADRDAARADRDTARSDRDQQAGALRSLAADADAHGRRLAVRAADADRRAAGRDELAEYLLRLRPEGSNECADTFRLLRGYRDGDLRMLHDGNAAAPDSDQPPVPVPGPGPPAAGPPAAGAPSGRRPVRDRSGDRARP